MCALFPNGSVNNTEHLCYEYRTNTPRTTITELPAVYNIAIARCNIMAMPKTSVFILFDMLSLSRTTCVLLKVILDYFNPSWMYRAHTGVELNKMFDNYLI